MKISDSLVHELPVISGKNAGCSFEPDENFKYSYDVGICLSQFFIPVVDYYAIEVDSVSAVVSLKMMFQWSQNMSDCLRLEKNSTGLVKF